MQRKILYFFLLGLVIIANSYGWQSKPSEKQKPPQQDDYVVKLGTTLVQIDAVVTDKNGKHVTDLRPDEFEILQDGKPQKITNFSYIVNESGKPELVAAKPSKETKEIKNAIETPIAPARLKKEDVKRTIA